ncbi:hypothetical protein VCR14J2_30059 [Vibrio coralliirubri]|nr:hypothetical protein VCR14J2_30059 [Vibrio coralliirubri]
MDVSLFLHFEMDLVYKTKFHDTFGLSILKICSELAAPLPTRPVFSTP